MLRAPSRSQCFSTLCHYFQFWVSEVWTVAGHRSGCCPAYAGASKQLEIVSILCVDAVDVECKRMERLPWTSASHVLFSWFFASNIWILVKYPLNSRARMAWNCDWSQIARQSFTSYWFIGLLCFLVISAPSFFLYPTPTQCTKSWKLSLTVWCFEIICIPLLFMPLCITWITCWTWMPDVMGYGDEDIRLGREVQIEQHIVAGELLELQAQ